ncbi:uncharacterized protein CG10915-like isoform X1 [Varroa jacobsoni]|uniref:uncharacterized protein CG10915-like isoform X1 n=2 Tax=Varroa jacobsoni TaxID=62625 RepID=UPI000BF51E33|nr:uncharacterized protein CG10915-like isoform X1 [Varroa jacobsoni]
MKNDSDAQKIQKLRKNGIQIDNKDDFTMSFPSPGSCVGSGAPQSKTTTNNNNTSSSSSSSSSSNNNNNNNNNNNSNCNVAVGGPNTVKATSVHHGVSLDRNDLIKLLGVLEGELQAREVVIAVLKSERIKQLVYPVGPRLARPGPRNPLTQLWQDALAATENFPPSSTPASQHHCNSVAAHHNGHGGEGNLPSTAPSAVATTCGTPVLARSASSLSPTTAPPTTTSNNKQQQQQSSLDSAPSGTSQDVMNLSPATTTSASSITTTIASTTAATSFPSPASINHRIDVNAIHSLQEVQAKLLENMISQNNELLTKVKERCCGGCQCQGAGSILGAGFIHDQLPSREPKEEAKEEAQRLFEAETSASAVLGRVREREKQMVLLLLAERHRLVAKLDTARQNCVELLRALREEKARNAEIVDGLEEESKRSLLLEEQAEAVGRQHAAYRAQCRQEVDALREENARQKAEIERLRADLERATGGGVRSQLISGPAPGPAHHSSAAPAIAPAVLAQRAVAHAPAGFPTPSGVPASAIAARSGDESRATGRPAPPPVPPNKPAILRKPAHLTAGAGVIVTPIAAATSTAHTAPVNASTIVSAASHDTFEGEIKNFQSVFVTMKNASGGGPAPAPPQATPPAAAGGRHA